MQLFYWRLCFFLWLSVGAQGEGLCSYCLFLSVVTKVIQVGGKLGGFTDSTSKGVGFFLLPTEEGLAVAVEAKEGNRRLSVS